MAELPVSKTVKKVKIICNHAFCPAMAVMSVGSRIKRCCSPSHTMMFRKMKLSFKRFMFAFCGNVNQEISKLGDWKMNIFTLLVGNHWKCSFLDGFITGSCFHKLFHFASQLH